MSDFLDGCIAAKDARIAMLAEQRDAEIAEVVRARQQIAALVSQVAELEAQVAEWEGLEGRCPVGHNKQFSYRLDPPGNESFIGCVACERDEAEAEVERLHRERAELHGLVVRARRNE